MTEERDHRDASRVIPKLDAGARPLAEQLLAHGFRTVSAIGPEQMAVMWLVLEKDGLRVSFESERGLTSIRLECGARRAEYVDAVFAWSRAPGAHGEPHQPHYRPLPQAAWLADTWDRTAARGAVDHWRDVFRWFPHADPGLLDVVRDTHRMAGALARDENGARSAAAVVGLYEQRIREYLARPA